MASHPKTHGAAAPRQAQRFAGLEEPDLCEMIEDPILRRLLASDGVRPDHLMAIIAETRDRLTAQ